MNQIDPELTADPGISSPCKDASSECLQNQEVQNPSSKGVLEHDDYDLVILGSGSAAFAAAIRATENGYKALIVEEGLVGGTCVNRGCIPSKALIHAAEYIWSASHSPLRGVETGKIKFSYSDIVSDKDELVRSMRSQKYVDLAAKYGFVVAKGHGRFTSKNTVSIDGLEITSKYFLIATGATPAEIDVDGFKEIGYLTSEDILNLTHVPKTLAVIGTGSIGLELGQLFMHLGSKVTFLETESRILPSSEPEVSKSLTTVLEQQGAEIFTSASLNRACFVDAKKSVRFKDVKGVDVEISVDEVLVATGRNPNTKELNLAAAGVKTTAAGAIVVDDYLRTTNPRILAAGDVVGGPQYVYVAGYEGTLAAENALLGANRRLDFSGLPSVIFTSPQIASVGLSEKQAIEEGLDVIVSVLPLELVPRARVNGNTSGFIKVVVQRNSSRVLGASIVSDVASEIIQSIVLAIKFEIKAQDLLDVFFPYLTMVEGIKLALQGLEKDVNMLSCCAL